MTHKDDVSFLPGNAPQLATLADPVYNAVNSRGIEDLATRFTVAGGQVVAVVDKLKSMIEGVDGAWDGASADSFVNYMSTFATAGHSVSDALTNVANDLRNAGTAIEGARDVLEGIFANLVTEVQSLQGQSDEDPTDKINEAVERYRPQVEEQVNAANGVLTNVATAVTGRLTELTSKFSELGDPDTSPFTPGGGRPMEWTPVVPDGPAPGDPQTDPNTAPQTDSPQSSAPPAEAPQTDPQSSGPPPGDPQAGAPQPGSPQPGAPQAGDPQAGGAQGQPGEQPPGDQPPGDQPPADRQATTDKILATARGELGYEEGPNDENKYGPPAAWCSSFATWVWRQSGVDIPSLPFTGDVYNWGVAHNQAYDSNNLGQARPGDVLLFGTGPQSPSTSTHIGVVESVDGGKVTLIEGNSSDRVQRVTYNLSSGNFYGGVHPTP
ncbi:CHAP domain-containing protein [Labedaea rhizosphaerae]|uniref:WXG100 family type VII secretion target n=1 Tax=Labedaea rhizosphaerae TaxID=598644 RepID=A0A4R6SE55_LABRH|nr:CHAP domain-containing protein [Labedaea rhizosphaerae]TDP97987.1 WXG100 family type VII secretion target [Labedaea rhizosphaerae]